MVASKNTIFIVLSSYHDRIPEFWQILFAFLMVKIYKKSRQSYWSSFNRALDTRNGVVK